MRLSLHAAISLAILQLTSMPVSVRANLHAYMLMSSSYGWHDTQVLDRLPIVDIRWKVPQLKSKKGAEEGQPGIQEYELDVQLKRVAGKKGGAGLARVYAPRFPKVCTIAKLSLEALLREAGNTGN